MNEARKVNRFAVAFALGLAILLIASLYVYVVERGKIIPPRGLATLESFERDMPPAAKLAAIDFGGSKMYIWVGRRSSWWFASGPPCYVFDSSGKMIEWDWQTGSGQPTTPKVRMAMEGESITVSQAWQDIIEF